MSDERLRTLIAELQELRLRESAILDEIVSTDQARGEEEKEQEDERAVTADGTSIQVGSRVRIKNKVRRPASAGPTWTESKERLAFVTRFYREQVHVVTDNGTNTWRAKNNLQLIAAPSTQP